MENPSNFHVQLAKTPADLVAIQRLRYEVFVVEMGANTVEIDHEKRLEQDIYDAHCRHLMLLDLDRSPDRSEQLVGVYRVLTQKGADAAGGFYSATEFDLDPLLKSGRNLLELGRSCLRKSYRGGSAMFYLWQGLSTLIVKEDAEILFGSASFKGTNIAALAQPLSLLHEEYLTSVDLRPKVLPQAYVSLSQLEKSQIERLTALKAMPALIKAYLRLGGGVADGAFIDQSFNTTDVCMVLDIKRMSSRQKSIYFRKLK